MGMCPLRGEGIGEYRVDVRCTKGGMHVEAMDRAKLF
jgi:hypothetical protein